jgi:hypothetical protein
LLLAGALALCAITACRHDASEGATAAPPKDGSLHAPAPVPTPAIPGLERLRIEGSRFVTRAGSTFEWRGITAFRLVDYIADGESGRAEAFLDWAAQQRLTVVRVLTMMGGLFDLRPEDGRRALPRLLELAAFRGLYVEVVALAGTADIAVDLTEHVESIGRILADHPNGLLEIANEPVHPSQAPEVHKPDALAALATRVPRDVPVSLGSIERGDGFGAGTYITWHAPRESGRGGWGHVLALAEGAALLARWQKPVVSDEPIGAGPAFQPGRRDDDPWRFRAAAILTRLAGMGATFHYDAGIHARVPDGRELDCFKAWNEAWALLPRDVEREGTFVASGGAVKDYDRRSIAGVFERSSASRGWILVIGDDAAALTLNEGWTIAGTRRIDGGRLLQITR